MPGINYTDVLPYASLAGGALVGMGGEVLAQRMAAAGRKTLNGEWGDIATEHQPSRLRRMASVITGPLVVVGLLAGASNGLLWQGETPDHVNADLQLVIDRSGATAFAENDAVGLTNTITTAVDKSGVPARALVANSGQVRGFKPSDVAGRAPFGDAHLREAMETALDDVAASAENAEKSGSGNYGVLAITYGNSLGATDPLIDEANREHVRVFIANVDPNGSAAPASTELQKIARQTGGGYWDASKDNVDDIASEVSDSLDPASRNEQQPHRWPLRIIVGAVSLMGFGVTAKKRSEMTFKV